MHEVAAWHDFHVFLWLQFCQSLCLSFLVLIMMWFSNVLKLVWVIWKCVGAIITGIRALSCVSVHMVLILHSVNKALWAKATFERHVCLSCVLMQDMWSHIALANFNATVFAIQEHMISIFVVHHMVPGLEPFITLIALEISFVLTNTPVVMHPLFLNTCRDKKKVKVVVAWIFQTVRWRTTNFMQIRGYSV